MVSHKETFLAKEQGRPITITDRTVLFRARNKISQNFKGEM